VLIDAAGAEAQTLYLTTGATVTVTGVGASYTGTDLDLDGGTLNVEAGGSFEASQGFLNDGVVEVTGADSVFTVDNDLMMGRDTAAVTVTVEAGGHLSSNRSFIGEGDGYALASSIDAVVTGAGSVWDSGTYFAVGGTSTMTATLTVSAGGIMTNDGSNGSSVVGRGGLGAATVTGAGSEIRTGDLGLGLALAGKAGTGTLTIDDGGMVTADELWFGSDVGDSGTLHLNGTSGHEGVLFVDDLYKYDGSGTAEFNGGILRARQDAEEFIGGFSAGDLIAETGGMFVDSNGFTIATSNPVSGVGALTKLGTGTLILSGANTYLSGTTISAGTLQLGNGGDTGSILGDVADEGVLAFDRSDVVTFGGSISGSGGIDQIGDGTTILAINNSGLTGLSQVHAGALEIDGILGGTMAVHGGRLQGTGTVGPTTNFADGTIAPGNGIGTLTIDGGYTGNDGTLEIEAVLAGDSSPSDLLEVAGDTAGTTNVHVVNLGGAGAQTTNGIKIVDVTGASNGSFALLGDYVFQGEQAVVAGAYGYRLYKDGVSGPPDGDWYLRSALLPTDAHDPGDPDSGPLYQAGAPIYETYAAVLQGFNVLETLQQRVGNRSWSDGSSEMGNGIWGRIVASHASVDPKASTTGATHDDNSFQLQAGTDGLLYAADSGSLVGGVLARYGTVAADVNSFFGDGAIHSAGYGLGGSLTWYGASGFYLDGQANLTWYDSTLSSTNAGASLVAGNRGLGYAAGLELGQRIALGPNWSLTPQAQLTYSRVDYDNFTDAFGAPVALIGSDTLQGRLGLSADYENNWVDGSGAASRLHAYGIANLYYGILPQSSFELAGVTFTSEAQRLQGGLGFGGTYSLGDGKYALHGEATVKTSLSGPGQSYDGTATAGLSVKF
jgi:fibronectin-binding autotransporter adhesin